MTTRTLSSSDRGLLPDDTQRSSAEAGKEQREGNAGADSAETSRREPRARFSYDFSPMSVVVKEKSKRWYEFLTSLMAILGGTVSTFTIVELTSGAVETVGTAVKDALGKKNYEEVLAADAFPARYRSVMSWGNKRSWNDDSWKDSGYSNKGAYWSNTKRSRTDDWKDNNGGSWGQGGRRRDREPYKTKEDLDADLEKYFGRSTEGDGGTKAFESTEDIEAKWNTAKSLDHDLDTYMNRKGEEGKKDEAKEPEAEADEAEEAEKGKEDS
ncbi:unnamed protein product [Durusdinium trenchii]|uniref:Uncharacterized protein n=1 Tax=Durusdinium trenchii TaxID=1381693 RepID=A0ABP0P995_9DINO